MPEIGQTISHYKIIEKIGADSMGVGYRTKYTSLEEVGHEKTSPHDHDRASIEL